MHSRFLCRMRVKGLHRFLKDPPTTSTPTKHYFWYFVNPTQIVCPLWVVYRLKPNLSSRDFTSPSQVSTGRRTTYQVCVPVRKKRKGSSTPSPRGQNLRWGSLKRKQSGSRPGSLDVKVRPFRPRLSTFRLEPLYDVFPFTGRDSTWEK